MTGFARAGGEIQTGSRCLGWQFEIKSVNGKTLEIKTRLPQSYEDMAVEFKKIAGKYLQRGNVSLALELRDTPTEASVRINEALLTALADKALDLYRSYRGEIEKPRSSELLAIKGVIETEETPLDETVEQELRRRLTADFEVLCQKLAADRQAEGQKIGLALQDILSKIGAVTAQIDAIADAQPDKIKAKLQEQLKLLSDAPVSEDRLAQEIVFFVTRADVREEVDRLKAHLKTAAELLKSSEAVGRRLDFLCQELNREANTTCSKSTDTTLTALGMELKALIEQFREQVQNIE